MNSSTEPTNGQIVLTTLEPKPIEMSSNRLIAIQNENMNPKFKSEKKISLGQNVSKNNQRTSIFGKLDSLKEENGQRKKSVGKTEEHDYITFNKIASQTERRLESTIQK